MVRTSRHWFNAGYLSGVVYPMHNMFTNLSLCTVTHELVKPYAQAIHVNVLAIAGVPTSSLRSCTV